MTKMAPVVVIDRRSRSHVSCWLLVVLVASGLYTLLSRHFGGLNEVVAIAIGGVLFCFSRSRAVSLSVLACGLVSIALAATLWLVTASVHGSTVFQAVSAESFIEYVLLPISIFVVGGIAGTSSLGTKWLQALAFCLLAVVALTFISTQTWSRQATFQLADQTIASDSVFRSPNLIARSILLCLPIAVLSARRQGIAIGAFAIGGYLVLITASRTGLLGLLLVAGMLLMVSSRITTLMKMLIALATVAVVFTQGDQAIDRLTSLAPAGEPELRMQLLDKAWDQIQVSPLVGLGPGQATSIWGQDLMHNEKVLSTHGDWQILSLEYGGIATMAFYAFILVVICLPSTTPFHLALRMSLVLWLLIGMTATTLDEKLGPLILGACLSSAILTQRRPSPITLRQLE